jgi:signal transduction histidine kinase/DNA-binding response OmpR family regulator
LYADESGKLWIGTQGNGLFELNLQTGQENHYRYNIKNKKSITGSSVRAILKDNDGILWVGTDKGLNKFNHLDSTFSPITKKDGLISNLVRAVQFDKSGNLWISTDKGISKYNPRSKQIRNFTVGDGLHDNEFWLSSHTTEKGMMFFGGKSGLTYFYPDSIKNDTSMPPVVITDFQIFNKSIRPAEDSPLKQHISEVNEIELAHDQSVFSFEFAALEYHHPQKITYAYMMENVDPDWVYTDYSRRFVTYTHLDPGTYNFRVKAANRHGIWNEQLASVKITILPPWWATLWAYSLYIIVLLSIVYVLRRYELNRLHLKHDLQIKETEANKLQELDNLKSKFFANISHEFRTPLTLILGPITKFIDKSSNEDDKKQYSLIQRNALRLQRLINQLLDLSRLEAGKLKLNAHKTDIVQFTKTITAAFESHAERRNIRLVLDTSLKDLEIMMDRDKYEKILTNLLSNAFKFSEDDTAITITMEKIEDSLNRYKEGQCCVKVIDEGEGIPNDKISRIFDRFYQVDSDSTREQEGSGIGLALIKELVELHQGTITVKSQPAQGSVFTVCLPLGKEHLAEKDIIKIPVDEIEIENYDISRNSVPDQPSENFIDENLPLLLIVEDNMDVQNYLAGILEREYNLIFAANGQQGINQALKSIPDLIVSDVMMPGMDGFEMCAKIKNDRATSHIPVILLTARSGQESLLTGLNTGADDYLTKPFNARELLVRIHNLIEQRKRLQEMFNRLNPFTLEKFDVGENDRSFLGKAILIINKNISNSDFNTDCFASQIALSRAQLFRKLKSLTGKSVSEFIRHVRLQRAADLLSRKQGNVSEVAFEVGFNNLSNFSENFKKQFGVLPSEYAKSPKLQI